ncbi:MAG: hypothetical protein LBP75_06705 [Planctomycetota bacterium]|jgi:hypothetical protein|nr:hypothetical protein [Planctomycetota bacterium]
MIHNTPKPSLSRNFTIDDIHRIREWNYEQLKDATLAEQVTFYRDGSAEVLAMIDASRAKGQGA